MVNKLFIFYLFKIQTQIQTQIKTQIRKIKIRKTQIKTQIKIKIINKYKKEFIIVKIVDVNYKTQLY